MADDKRKAMSVKLSMDVIISARIVSSYRDEPMSDMLSNILRPILAKMETEETEKRRRAIIGAPATPSMPKHEWSESQPREKKGGKAKS